ncbi:MAG: SpoIVB peptidase [Clostridia bacterium]|nr:SpoIVB peptidase [Clostridia bacterium]
MKNNRSKIKSTLSLIFILCLLSAFILSADAATGSRSAGHQDDGGIEVGSRFHELIFGKKEEKKAEEDIYLCPGGDAFGVKIRGGGVSVSKVIDEGGSPFREGDFIKSIDGQPIDSIDDVKEALKYSGGKELTFTVLRGRSSESFSVTPRVCADEYHLGVILKDGATGIGTITYYDPKTREFGGLGHGISYSDGKELRGMSEGTVTGVILAGATRGKPNQPGELRGVLTESKLGDLYANTECGVFGTLDCNLECTSEIPIPIAKRNEVAPGEATILTTVKSGKRASYKIEIDDINYSSESTKSFKIRVTDDALIALTGGIVRGMSGSPIIQDGKLVGAVTHVMVANPTEGYGIFIENMLNAAQGQSQPEAA